jgi:hypothetical protein
MQKFNQLIAHPSSLMQLLLSSSVVEKGFLWGGDCSSSGTSTLTVGACAAMDSTGVALMSLAATTKTNAAWAVGAAAGGLDTGTIAVNTWYHLYVIRRPDTGVVDFLISLNATTPTLPASYTQYRRVGSWKTSLASTNWDIIVQTGDQYRWPVYKGEYAAVPGATTAFTLSLTMVPTGIVVDALLHLGLSATTAQASPAAATYVSPLALTDDLVNFNASAQMQITTIAGSTMYGMADVFVKTNASAQVRHRSSWAAGTGPALYINTLGWTDTRGRIS